MTSSTSDRGRENADRHEHLPPDALQQLAGSAGHAGAAAPRDSSIEGIYQLITESIPQLIWRAGPDGMIDYLSDQWYAFTGVTRPHAMRALSLHQDWHSVIQAEDAAAFMKQWMQCVQSGARFEAECRIHRAGDGFRWHLCRAVPVRDNQGRILSWFGTATNIDSEKRERDGMSIASHAKDRFLAMLSHELRTPLAPVLLIVSELEADPALPAHLLSSVQMLRRNIEREVQLVGDLVDVSAALKGKLSLRCKPLDIGDVIQQALEVCRTELDAKKIILSFALKARNSIVIGDSMRLQQILWNLLKNAAKFTPVGGEVEIGSSDVSDDRVRIWVKDNGIGISPEALRRVFAPFEQGDASTASRYGGLGLGLAIARNIAELHQGSLVGVSDGLGHGTTFILELPLLPQDRIPEDFDAAGSEPPRAQPEKLAILLVDDHADTLQAMTRLLRSFGHEVDCAQSAAAALACARAKAFDLVVSDVRLPDKTGWELMRALREFTNVPAIALTGLGSEDDLLRSREAGFNEHIIKPADPATLRAVISSVMAQAMAAESSHSKLRPIA